MRKTILCLATLALLFSGAHAAPEEPEAFGPDSVPAILKPYMKGSVFTPGNYEWMRGKFADASKEQKAEYNTVFEWREGCSDLEKSRVRAELATMGYPDATLEFLPITTQFCDQFAIEPQISSFDSFADFTSHLATTKPIFDALAASIDLAEVIGHPHRRSFAEKLTYRVTGEQMARHAFSWSSAPDDRPRIPTISEAQKPIFRALLSAEVGRRDRSNTDWLKSEVSKSGWPTISNVGKEVSSDAWLIAQHADHDPLFQLKVLRIMEPMLSAGEVSKRNYAYLYDRVMLKLVGTQRFATQVTCKDGERVARPLENEAELAELRVSVDLEPFEEYLTWFSAPCPEPE